MDADTKHEILLEHKFVISLQKIMLNSIKPTRCTLKYHYNLFTEDDVSTEPFNVDVVEEWVKIPLTGFNEFTIPRTLKESEVKNYLSKNILVIRLLDETTEIGITSINLLKLYNTQSYKFRQQSIKEEIVIENPERNGIGTIECLIVLLTQEYVTCKSCKKDFKRSGLRKHISQRPACEEGYGVDDLQVLKDESDQNNRKRKYKFEFQNYDPVKRAQNHENKVKKEWKSNLRYCNPPEKRP